MTNKNYYTESYDKEHLHFGGGVYDYDFNEYVSMTEIASRIESDLKKEKSILMEGKKNESGRPYGRNYRA